DGGGTGLLRRIRRRPVADPPRAEARLRFGLSGAGQRPDRLAGSRDHRAVLRLQHVTTASDRYIRPNWFTRNVFNRIVAWLTQMGISAYGSRILAVRGRRSGRWYATPVNLLEYRGERFLVAPRGVTQWVR